MSFLAHLMTYTFFLFSVAIGTCVITKKIYLKLKSKFLVSNRVKKSV